MLTNRILLTGGAGFIGSHVAETLLQNGYEVHCIDNFDPFYAPEIKWSNLSNSLKHRKFHFYQIDLSVAKPEIIMSHFLDLKFDAIIHLAGKAGVRPSIDHAEEYYATNLIGSLHLLEYARQTGISRFIYASSSSVYGNSPTVPWKENEFLPEPISPYAASKLAGEELGMVYARLYNIRFLSLRLFTVYGPRQRPDLAINKFYNLISAGQPIVLFGDGNSQRDYTFISDIVKGILAALYYEGSESIFNLGNNHPVELLHLVNLLEEFMQTSATIHWEGDQPGDVRLTYADIERARIHLNYQPAISIEEGIQAFVNWKKDVYRTVLIEK
jgi:UDP-glucuronate 4-epimerase